MRRYDELFAAEAAKTGKFLEGARVVVEAMLQSPHFLYRTELSSNVVAGRIPSAESTDQT